MMNINYELGAKLHVTCSGEAGEVIGRAEYIYAEPAYLLRYADNTGKAVEQWWPQSALAKTDTEDSTAG